MNVREMYWLAGLLEGDGSFVINKKTNCPAISLGMNDKDIVEKAARLLGNVPVYSDILPGGSTRYRFRLNGKPAIQAMVALRPLMGKRRQKRMLEIIKLAEGRPMAIPKIIDFPELKK